MHVLQKRGHAVRSCMGVFFSIRNSCVRGCHRSCSVKIRFANPTKTEQRPDGHVHKDGAAGLCTNPKHSPTEWHPRCCTTITIIICRSTPFIVPFLLLLLLLILPLPYPSRPTTITSTLPTPSHTTTTIVPLW